ncbi:MAG: SpoIIE family protein phosphatase [Acidobacteriota bacterium]|nr:SpoIIE family protein phosphatase [Acidobacteriota bacterium]
MDVPRLRYADQEGQHSVTLKAASTSIGRSPGQDVVMSDPCVSRQHAMIVNDGSVWTVVDRNSTHGTFLNGTRVQRADLKHGDVLQLGSLEGSRIHFQLDTGSGLDASSGHNSVSGLLSSMTLLAPPSQPNRPEGSEIERLNWLLGAARQLNAGGAITEILTTLLQLTLQLTGVERGFVFLRENGEMRLALGLTADGRIVDEDSTVSRRAMQRAIESESKFSISDTTADENVSAWASVMVNKIRSIYAIPLRKRDSKSQQTELLGLLYLDSQIGVGNLSEVDHQVLDTIATEAAALLHNVLLAEEEYNARRAREELEIAARIHSGLMSITLPEIPYAVLQAKSIPCLEIGGDFYEAIMLEDCVCVGIADVSGKGVPAAIVAATLQGIIHAQLRSRQSLPEIAALVNHFLCTRNVGKYATMVLLKLSADGTVEYINCGHVKPLLIQGDVIRELEDANPIVGLLAGATYVSARCKLHPGERLLLATDGLAEAENSAGECFGDSGLGTIASYEDVAEILDSVARFQAPNEAQDDCTLVAIQYNGLPE